jgi:hypothetical protein
MGQTTKDNQSSMTKTLSRSFVITPDDCCPKLQTTAPRGWMLGLSRAVCICAPGNLGRTPKVLPAFGRDKATAFGPEQRSVLEDRVRPLLAIRAPQSIRPSVTDLEHSQGRI